MTIEQAIKSIQDKESLRIKIRIEIEQTKKKLIELTPLKYGQKVLVTNHRKEKIICFISGSEYKPWIKCGYEYTFTKPKKDGTMGLQSAAIYSAESIEPIN